MQRSQTMDAALNAHFDYLEAAVEYEGRSLPKWLLYEVVRSCRQKGEFSGWVRFKEDDLWMAARHREGPLSPMPLDEHVSDKPRYWREETHAHRRHLCTPC